MQDSGYNPDILTCLANLSSDEVFTPPKLANAMLDQLPPELWNDKNARFLDPACKSGIFLREIAKRLDSGLEESIPDRQERINHIFSKQLYGLSITELTSLLSRRSVYCSKAADGKYSVCEEFDSEQGNIIFNRVEHVWTKGRCAFCGASQKNYERGEALETHAYQFIHAENLEELFNMKFDVIVGNPPYQLSDGGGEGSSAISLYHRFIENAIKLNPRFLTMIIPARWYSGGKGLDSFRNKILHDERLSIIHDFPETSDCFPGLNIRGGVCYFLWESDHQGPCEVFNHIGGQSVQMKRLLLEKRTNTFIRYNQAISILSKVITDNILTMDSRVSSRNPFGIPSNFAGYSKRKGKTNSVTLFRGDRSSSRKDNRRVYVGKEKILKNHEYVNRIKVIVSKASPGGDDYPHAILTNPIIADKNSVCTETYLIVDFVKTVEEARNLTSYLSTRFFRFMVALLKNTQNISKKVFALTPIQDWNQSWTDKKLYKKYGLTEDEINFIESKIRPMELSNE